MRLRELLQEAILEESASVEDVTSAIDNHNRIIINYHSKGKEEADGARVIEVYAYGVTKAGNPVIRAFQPYGDTTSRVPSWKFFRLDRIVEWRPTEQKFSHPASDYYKGLGEYNENGDRTMAMVYKTATFGDDDVVDNDTLKNIADAGVPKLKPEIEKTETEKRMERLRQQVANPIKLSDLTKQKPAEGPILKPSAEQEKDKESEEEIYKTDTERGIENLRKQLENPTKIDLDKFNKKKEEVPQEQQNEPEEEKDDVFRTDTEERLRKLRQQLDNPTKIDLTKIPKR